MTNALLKTLAERGVELTIVGDSLRCEGRAGVLDDQLKEAIRSHKTELMARLKEPLPPPKPSWRQYYLKLARRWERNAKMCDRSDPEAATKWRAWADRHRELAAEQGVSSQIAGGEAGRSTNARP